MGYFLQCNTYNTPLLSAVCSVQTRTLSFLDPRYNFNTTDNLAFVRIILARLVLSRTRRWMKQWQSAVFEWGFYLVGEARLYTVYPVQWCMYPLPAPSSEPLRSNSPGSCAALQARQGVGGGAGERAEEQDGRAAKPGRQRRSSRGGEGEGGDGGRGSDGKADKVDESYRSEHR